MNDLSVPMAALFDLGGLGMAVLLGYQMRGPRRLPGLLIAALLSLVLGLGLSVCIALAHTTCIERFHACVSRGDADVSVWLSATLAIPVYWLVMLAMLALAPAARSPGSS